MKISVTSVLAFAMGVAAVSTGCAMRSEDSAAENAAEQNSASTASLLGTWVADARSSSPLKLVLTNDSGVSTYKRQICGDFNCSRTLGPSEFGVWVLGRNTITFRPQTNALGPKQFVFLQRGDELTLEEDRVLGTPEDPPPSGSLLTFHLKRTASGAKSCGGFLGAVCGPREFCSFAPEAQCGAADHPGTCSARPDVCPEVLAPVCGCDGQTYENSCFANLAGVSVRSTGACDGGGQACGPTVCRAGTTCCDPLHGMCAEPGSVCAQ